MRRRAAAGGLLFGAHVPASISINTPMRGEKIYTPSGAKALPFIMEGVGGVLPQCDKRAFAMRTMSYIL
jgi:hypothetical protein